MYGGVTGKVREDLPMSIVHLGVVFQIPCGAPKLRRLRNSLRSNSPRRISEVGCAPRPRQRRVYLQVMVRGLEKTEMKNFSQSKTMAVNRTG